MNLLFVCCFGTTTGCFTTVCCWGWGFLFCTWFGADEFDLFCLSVLVNVISLEFLFGICFCLFESAVSLSLESLGFFSGGLFNISSLKINFVRL